MCQTLFLSPSWHLRYIKKAKVTVLLRITNYPENVKIANVKGIHKQAITSLEYIATGSGLQGNRDNKALITS